MAVNSNGKGKRGELEAVKLLKSLGFADAMRTAQYSGKDGGPADVVCPTSLPRVHIEVKSQHRREMDLGVKGLQEACTQAMSDAAGKPWCVLWRPTGVSQWRLTWDCGIRVTVAHDHEIAVVLQRLQDRGKEIQF